MQGLRCRWKTRGASPWWTRERAGRYYVISLELEESAEHLVRSPRLLVRTVEHHSAIVSAVSVLRAVSWDFAPDGKVLPTHESLPVIIVTSSLAPESRKSRNMVRRQYGPTIAVTLAVEDNTISTVPRHGTPPPCTFPASTACSGAGLEVRCAPRRSHRTICVQPTELPDWGALGRRPRYSDG